MTSEPNNVNETEVESREPTKRPPLRVIVIVASISLAALLILAWILFKSASARSAASTSETITGMQTVTVSRVVSRDVDRQLKLPGELNAYQDVAVFPKVQGFVKVINVDRGSVVKRGQLLVRMSAPELSASTAEAQARVGVSRDQRLEMEARVRNVREQKAEATAKLTADEGTYRRLKGASGTPGVVAENDVDIARQTLEADRATVRAIEETEKAALAVVQSQTENQKAALNAAKSVRDIESYLNIRAPFDGIITERNVDEGSLVGPSSGAGSTPMVRIRQVSTLRLVVPVPEAEVAAVTLDDKIPFSVPAFPNESFWGVVARISHALDQKTRTMPVELDVVNNSARLAPGMYPEVVWPAKRLRPSLFVPASAIAVSTERTFVVRIRNGTTEWVDVKRGVSMGDLVEVFGDLAENDLVATRGTDELRSGIRVSVKESPAAH